MEDFVKIFFERDLTETEEKQLDSLLESSQDEAFRFLDTAKSLYLQTGLPNPEKPLGGSSATGGLSGGAKVLGAFLTGAVLTTLSWWAWEKRQTPAPLPPALNTIKPVVPAIPADTSHLQPIPKKSVIVRQNISASINPIQPQPYIAGKKYGGLNAVVKQTASGLITVRVLDSQGKETRLLFAGLLESGEWNFTWDGRKKDGLLAEEGVYWVETESGKTILRKKIRIGLEPGPGSTKTDGKKL